MESTPASSSSTNASDRTLKIAGLALLGCVALCGLAGTCLLAVSLLYPVLVGSGVGP
jgi:hypothetical protein